MKFRYSARTKTGELQVGFVEGVNRDSAFNVLSGHDLFILSLEKVEAPKWYHTVILYFFRVKRKDLTILTRQFATMLEAKIPIRDALKALYEQTTNQTLKEAVFNISTDIDAGIPLSQSFERHSEIFSEFYINMIQSAEVTGHVEEAMGFLADYLEKELLLLSKVKTALIYPIFVISLTVIVSAILIGFVFPQISPIFEEADFQLPFITRTFLSLGKFINQWWIAITVFFGAFIVIVVDYIRTAEGKSLFDQFILGLPLFGPLFKKVYVARFATISSTLIKGGIPIAQAIEIGGHTVGSPLYRELLHEVAEAVRRGELLSQAFLKNQKYFPPIVNQMVVVGEQTGKLDEMFVRISTFYSREVDSVVNNLTELLQPVLMVFIGVIVGLLFAAILLPIYNLIQVIR